MTNNAVNHPNHYQFQRPAHELGDIIAGMRFYRGSAVKYLYRAGKKPGSSEIQDLEKAMQCIALEIAALERQAEDSAK